MEEISVPIPQHVPPCSGFKCPKIFFKLKDVMEFSSEFFFKLKEEVRGVRVDGCLCALKSSEHSVFL